MQITQGNNLQSLRGVQAFLDAHSDTLASVANSGARKKLDLQVEALSAHVLAQSGSDLAAQGATQKQYALRQTLIRNHMAPIARIAAADLPETPELVPLRMPKGNVSTEKLYAAAKGMADTAEKHAAVFTDAGLAADFLVKLRTAADAILVPVDARMQSRSTRQAATNGLTTAARSARKTVRVLDALVRVALEGNPSLLAGWDAVRRPAAKPGVATGSVTPVPEPTPAAPITPGTAATPAAPAAPAAALALVTTQD